jgi:hypothetical protein
MFFEDEEKDWKELLDDKTKQVLAELFDISKRHRGAYSQAEDVKAAQLWCALAEVMKELKETRDVAEKLSEPFRAIVEMGDVEKKRTIERLVRDLVKPEPGQEEATQKLVESLMKF